MLVRLGAPLCLLLIVACGSGESDGKEGEAADDGTLRVAVCQQSEGWVKPSVEEQRAMVWSQPRYAGRDEAQMQAIFDEQFFTWHGGNSELFDAWPLHGRWAVQERRGIDACASDPEVARGRYVDIFLLNHRASEVSLSGSTYEVTVEATERGFQHVEVVNELYASGGPPVAYSIRVVTEAGEELASFAECASEDKTKGCQSTAPGSYGRVSDPPGGAFAGQPGRERR